MIAGNLKQVRERIDEACRASGRDPASVTLIAVGKTFGSDAIMEASRAGQVDFGENYAQELAEKHRACADLPLRWHFIGHLQSNKVRTIVDYVHMVHTVDSMTLAAELHKRAAKISRIVDVLIEVHTTNESSKSGIAPERALSLARELAGLSHLRLRGLMTMGPLSDHPEDGRKSYKRLRSLLDEGRHAGLDWKELSMGMSHDFPIAIQEGATLVRVGTAIFGQRTTTKQETP